MIGGQSQPYIFCQDEDYKVPVGRESESASRLNSTGISGA